MVTRTAALEESFFLGLRLNRGVRLSEIEKEFGAAAVRGFDSAIAQSITEGLLEREGDVLRLTARGRLLSNEVFERFLVPEPVRAR